MKAQDSNACLAQTLELVGRNADEEIQSCPVGKVLGLEEKLERVREIAVGLEARAEVVVKKAFAVVDLRQPMVGEGFLLQMDRLVPSHLRDRRRLPLQRVW